MVGTFPSIKVGIMVGIGGGIPPKVRLGDVVVSTPVDQYPGVVQWDFGKAEKYGDFKRTGALNNPPTALLTALTKLETKHDMHGAKISQYLDNLKENWPNLVPKYTWVESLKDPLFAPDNSHRSRSRCEVIFSILWGMALALFGYLFGWWAFPPMDRGTEQVTSATVSTEVDRAQRKPGDVRVHYGLIASGYRVIKDAKFRDGLNESLGGNVLCVEMEAAGLMNDFPCIVIRGICDYADSQKNKDWQEYAAAVAAACAKELLEYVQPSDVDGERPVKDILGQVLDNIATVRSKLDRKEDLEILNWLTPIDYGPQHSDFLKRRQPGTGQWLLDSAEYQTWLNTGKQKLFCPGIPGAGKTILTSIVVDHLTNWFSNDLTIGIAYIYCNFKRKDEQKINDLLASLLKQLAQSQSSLPRSVKELYDRHNVNRTQPSLNDIAITIQSVATMYSRVFIVVDALDECQASNSCRAEFLSELFNLHAKCGPNIFATSRFIPEVTEKFKGSTTFEILAHDEDVRNYLDDRISRSELKLLQTYREEIKTEITKVVNGMFLLAPLHFESVSTKKTPKKMKDALNNLPTGPKAYDHVYEEAIKRITGHDPDSKELAEQVLWWIACAKRPLTTSELQHALAVEVGRPKIDKENFPEVEDMVSVCAGLVTVDEESNIIRLFHYTIQEYFERTQSHWFPDAETNIAMTCVTYLSFDTFESGFGSTDDEFERRLRLNPLYYYAARNWGHHAREASTVANQLILSFLESESKVSACTQAVIASRGHSGYSQRVPSKMIGIHLAAVFGLTEAMTGLLKNRLDPDVKDSYGQTPLWWAAGNGHDAVVEQLLATNNVDVNSKNNYGWTPLSFAVLRGHEAVVSRLLIRNDVVIIPNVKCRDHRLRDFLQSWERRQALRKSNDFAIKPLAQAIFWAARMEVDIISVGFVLDGSSDELDNAVLQAAAQGILLIYGTANEENSKIETLSASCRRLDKARSLGPGASAQYGPASKS